MLVERGTANLAGSGTGPGRVGRADPGAVEEPGSGVPRPVGQARLLPRRTFTVEAWVDRGHVIATQVVHLQTQDADAWYGWDPGRLLGFLEEAMGVMSPPAASAGPDGGAPREPVPAPSPVPESGPAPEPVPSAPPPSPLTVHRYGLVRAAGLAVGGGEVAARLRLDPADLDLPEDGEAEARVELIAAPAGVGRQAVIGARVVDLADRRAVDVLLRGSLAGGDAPFTILATVRILARNAGPRPHEGLGGATLNVVPAG